MVLEQDVFFFLELQQSKIRYPKKKKKKNHLGGRRAKKAKVYRLMETTEIDCKRALIPTGTQRLDGDVGDGRNHHERREVEEEGTCKQVTQLFKLLHISSSDSSISHPLLRFQFMKVRNTEEKQHRRWP